MCVKMDTDAGGMCRGRGRPLVGNYLPIRRSSSHGCTHNQVLSVPRVPVFTAE